MSESEIMRRSQDQLSGESQAEGTVSAKAQGRTELSVLLEQSQGLCQKALESQMCKHLKNW